jgi:hypothetical protein
MAASIEHYAILELTTRAILNLIVSWPTVTGTADETANSIGTGSADPLEIAGTGVDLDALTREYGRNPLRWRHIRDRQRRYPKRRSHGTEPIGLGVRLKVIGVRADSPASGNAMCCWQGG